jgi:dTDP-4-dehydrorhamnose 3,5-epimerase
MIKKITGNKVFSFSSKIFEDDRGTLKKIYPVIENFEIKDQYVTRSKKNTFRGLHYQVAPHGANKILTVLKGEIIDIALCMDKNSKYYLKKFITELSHETNDSIYIPKYFAHGFITPISSEVLCSMDDIYSPECERGVHIKSISEFEHKDFVLSEKDKFLEIINENIIK